MVRGQNQSYSCLAAFLMTYAGKFCLQVLIVFSGAALLVLPALVGQRLIDDGVLQGDRRVILGMGAVLGVLALVQAGAAYAERVFSARFGEELVLRLRRDVLAHLDQQPLGFFAYARPGAVVARIHGDVDGVRQLVAGAIPAALSAVATLVFAGGALLVLEWRAAIAVLVLAPLIYTMASSVAPRMRDVSHRELAAYSGLDGAVAEQYTLGGAELVRQHGAGPRMSAELVGRAGLVRDHALAKVRLGAVFGAGVSLVVGLAGAAIYSVGGLWVASGAITMGTLVAVASLLAMIYGPVTTLSTMKLDLVAGFVSFERVKEVMQFRPAVTVLDEPEPIRDVPPSISLHSVSFTYPVAEDVVLPTLADPDLGQAPEGMGSGQGRQPRAAESARQPTLRNIDVMLASGTMVGLVGPSGAGKSTLARLLVRTWDVGEGRIEIGGTNIAALSPESLNRAVGVVTQETFMFHGTIRANLLIADPDASEERIIQACRDAQIWEAIEKMPTGLDTILGERGVRVSGGERQRLALARLFLRVPPVVVLDEATSHLDTETERAVQQALRRKLRATGCLVIAHRLSTVRHADEILVMEGGCIVEQGRHEELMARDGLYRRLLAAQEGQLQPLAMACEGRGEWA